MDISKKLINDLAPKSMLVGTFFDEAWHQRHAIDIARARELTRQARENERLDEEEAHDDGSKEAWENYLQRD